MNGNRFLKPQTIRILWVVFALLLLLTVVTEAFIHTHARFGVDGSFGFHAWFGGAACIGMIAIARLLGLLLKRRDTYYDD